ncbi:MAG: TIGR00282 family metallophosphoesterase [candidate division Zixibacteria bacterium]|nr:TIGR00282 family metallophosphoesterase [candidate division KSB1 bacterium]NIR63104.1 TIGR00282 family metallophosphoesterase [candidate division Zixibacteria bacterium]NIT70311.1 TIGR00282 family metallophosphoesterase [candidate division KSB1 bacterium]NIV05258.1 TIGR00282 family metallophosphoesterase [candidate division Zixibacteria bacterium]NIX55091.1 TIGR00282 family metallophosphoesterase [candidate division Zixibacteria bacterium]
MRVLFIADLVGDDAVSFAIDLLPRIKTMHKIDFTIVNGENADKGKGITGKQVNRLKEIGVDCITSGNHIWDPRKRVSLIDHAGFLIRPLNYPEGNVGLGDAVIKLNNGHRIAVLNLQGRSFMYAINCPFKVGEKRIRQLRSEASVIIIDFHAEATAEKQALGSYFDGKVSAIIGTHTHVQTADERILPGGTAYITDAGMTGPENSVIGMDTQSAIDRFLLQSHVYYKIAKGKIRLNGVVLEIDENTGKATDIYRLNYNKEEFSDESQNY